MLDIGYLKTVFGDSITVCGRCTTATTITEAQHPYYGETPLVECPKCKEERIYPWEIYLIDTTDLNKPFNIAEQRE